MLASSSCTHRKTRPTGPAIPHRAAPRPPARQHPVIAETGRRPPAPGTPTAAGPVAVQPAAISSQEDRPLAPFADGQVDRPRSALRERNGDDLPAPCG